MRTQMQNCCSCRASQDDIFIIAFMEMRCVCVRSLWHSLQQLGFVLSSEIDKPDAEGVPRLMELNVYHTLVGQIRIR